jgi:DNA processing protein
VILSESPLGGPPLAENFPDRNRLLAALARVLVVVESPVGGGSLITYRLAVERGSTVMAVPGSIHSPMSAGPNGLLNEALPCRDVRDVEVAMGWALADLARPSESRPEPSAIGSRTLATMGWDPVTVDELVDRVGAGMGTVTLALAQLEADRWVERTNGRWQRLAGRS